LLAWDVVLPPSPTWPIGAGDAGYVGFAHDDCSSDDAWLCPITGALYSRDGRTWDRVEPPEETFTDAAVWAVTGYGDGFIAVGSDLALPIGPGSQEVSAATWFSEDGTSWHRNTPGPELEAGQISYICEGFGLVIGGMFEVAVAEGRAFASGSLVREKDGCPVRRGRVWTSVNGTDWHRTRLPSRTASVIGGVRFLSYTPGGRAWRSDDGDTWQKEALPVPDGAVIDFIVPRGDGYLAFGQVRDQESLTTVQFIWTSADGSIWETLVQSEPMSVDTAPWLFDAVTARDLTVAAGSFGLTPPDSTLSSYMRYGITTTRDGVTWSPPDTALFDGFTIDGLATTGGSIVASGFGHEYGDHRLWVANVP
jgi:hypothetical protein